MRKEPAPPTRGEINKIVSLHLRVVKRVKEKSGPHVIAQCPACGGRKLYVNLDTGMWDCKAGSCGEAGNLWRLADLLGVRVREKRLVRGLGEVLAEGLGATEDFVPEEPLRNAKGMSVDLIERQCERLFNPEYEKGARVLEYLHGRGFDEATIRHFRLGVAFWPGSKEVCLGMPFVERDKVPMVKFRRLEDKKPKYVRTKGSASPLFNADAVRERKQVILVEGELDAVSLWQLGFTNVASTSLGAKSDVPKEWKDHLADADDIVLWYDDDEAGQDAARALVSALGSHRCRLASWDDCPGQQALCGALKDANDILCAVAAGSTDLETAHAWCQAVIQKAKGIKNTTVVQPGNFADSVISELQAGDRALGTPCSQPSVRGLLKGWRPGEVTVVTGHTGHGKSTWLTAEIDSLAERGNPVLTSAFEAGPAGIARDIFQRKWGRPISTVRNDEDMSKALQVVGRLNENPVYIIDCYGRTPLQTIVDAITYAYHRLGVRHVVLDHLHYFLTKRPGQDEREAIDDVSMALTDLAVKLGIHIWLVCHPRGGVDEATIPTGDSLKGSSSLKQNAFNGITVFRSKGLNGDPTPRKIKLKDAQGKRVEIELGYLNALVYVWKARHREASEGATVLDFSPRNLTYSERKPKGEEDGEPAEGPAADTEQQEEDPWEDMLPF